TNVAVSKTVAVACRPQRAAATTATSPIRLWFLCRQCLRALQDFRLWRERSRFSAEDDAIRFLSERFDQRLGVCGDHFQIQKRDVELFQLFLKLFVRRFDE